MARREPTRTGVLFLTTETRPPLGADAWLHVQLIRTLDRATHDVHVACVTGPEDEPTPTFRALAGVRDVELVPVHLGERPASRSARDLWQAVRSLGPAMASAARLWRYVRRNDIAIIHTTDRPRDAFTGALLARSTRTKGIVHVHVGFGSWMSRLRRWAMHRGHARIAISEFVKRSLVANGYPADTTHVVLNAIDPDGWHPGEGRDAARAELGLADDAPVVITVCRLFPSKGVEALIRALARVHGELPDARVVVVGDDGPEQGRYMDELAGVARSLGVEDHVCFTGRRSDVPRLMAAADVFAMPSYEEPFGLVYLEAMAMRLPVVGLDNGGTPEVVEDGCSGLLSAPDDLDALAAHLVELLRDPARREAMGVYGRAQVDSRFTIERMAADVAAVYRLVASTT